MKKLRENKNILLGTLLLALIAGIFYWAFATRPNIKPAAKVKADKTMSYDDNTIVEEKAGKKLWELKAKSIVIDPKTQMATLKDMHGKYYEIDGGVLSITAPLGIYNQKNKNIEMQGGVSITGPDGMEFKAQKVHWDSQKGLFTGDGQVQIARGDMHASAEHIESGNGFTDFKLQGNANIVKGN